MPRRLQQTLLLLPTMCEEQLQKQFKTQINASRADRPAEAAAKYQKYGRARFLIAPVSDALI
jgi:hypothetical protein